MDKFGHFYFAYGSNLNDWRGLGLRPVGPATLPDEVLVFDHHSSRPLALRTVTVSRR